MNLKIAASAVVALAAAAGFLICEKAACDDEGYNKAGYDQNGYDREGYDESGYDANGYDREGYDRYGYNRDGYDRQGYDAAGRDQEGYDREGCHERDCAQTGRDRYGYDAYGFDADGEDRYGKTRGDIQEEIDALRLKLTDAQAAFKNGYLIEAAAESRTVMEKGGKLVIDHVADAGDPDKMNLAERIETCSALEVIDGEFAGQLLRACRVFCDKIHDEGEVSADALWFAFRTTEEFLAQCESYLLRG
jgi:hypothetical protein